MAIHASLALRTVASLFAGGVAFARQTGTTSGSAAGKDVEPSPATEKKHESGQRRLKGGQAGGGRPGVEGMPLHEGGAAPSEKINACNER